MWIINLLTIVCVLYLLALMPRMRHRPDRRPLMGFYYAHRGLYNTEKGIPENSMKAFDQAASAGYGIELDVQLTKDRVPVVFHDFTLDRTCGIHGKLSDYTWEELGQFVLCGTRERIPCLKEVLTLVDGRVPLIVELKMEWMDASVCQQADRLLSMYSGVYCVESFNPLGLMWYRKNRSHVVRGQLSDAFSREEGLKGIIYLALEFLLLNCLTKPDFIAYHHKYYRNSSRQLCRKLYGALAVAWTIKSKEEMNARKKDFDLFIFEGFIPADSEPK